MKYPRSEKDKLTPEEYDIISAITNEAVTNMDVSKVVMNENRRNYFNTNFLKES